MCSKLTVPALFLLIGSLARFSHSESANPHFDSYYRSNYESRPRNSHHNREESEGDPSIVGFMRGPFPRFPLVYASHPGETDNDHDGHIGPVQHHEEEDQHKRVRRRASYIRFDHYKDADLEHRHPHQQESRSIGGRNLTFHDSSSEEQRFFPSFPFLAPYAASPSLAPARSPLFPAAAFSPFKFAAAAANRGPSSAASQNHFHDNNILGSGNFEVVRGGTYYADHEDGPSGYHHYPGQQLHQQQGYNGDDDDYYGQHNGHSPPPYRGNGGGGGDFFANFRDFADINPHSRSYSHQHEVRLRPEDEKEDDEGLLGLNSDPMEATY